MQRGFLGYRVSPDAMIRFSYMNLAATTAVFDLEIDKRLDLAPASLRSGIRLGVWGCGLQLI